MGTVLITKGIKYRCHNNKKNSVKHNANYNVHNYSPLLNNILFSCDELFALATCDTRSYADANNNTTEYNCSSCHNYSPFYSFYYKSKESLILLLFVLIVDSIEDSIFARALSIKSPKGTLTLSIHSFP